MLVKSASLCDDCYKTAEQQCQEQQSIQPTAATSSNTTSISNNSQSPSIPTVINNKMYESSTSIDTAGILPDDDGYCQIDEIRLPAITKSPSIKITDPRRKSAPAPLPIETMENDDAMNKTDSTNDVTPSKSPTNSDNKSTKNNHDTPNNEQISNASSNLTSNTSGNVTTTPDAEHTEVNSAYDSLSQPLSALSLNTDSKAKLNNGASKVRSTCENLCLPEVTSFVGTQHAIPSIPCHLISAYVSALNLHISQLVVSIILELNFMKKKNRDINMFSPFLQPKLNERDIEREKLRKENQLLRDRLNTLHEREQTTQSDN